MHRVFAKDGNSDRSNWTLDMLYSRTANLVPDHAVLFTREAFEIPFGVKSLMHEIDTYAMYSRYGCFELDGNEFGFSELQRKMLDA